MSVDPGFARIASLAQQHPSVGSVHTLKLQPPPRTCSFAGAFWVAAICGPGNMSIFGGHYDGCVTWSHSGTFCVNTCPFTCSHRLPWYRFCVRCWGLLSLGCVASPGSRLTSLFPSSGNSSKKPTREWEPLSEPKVMPVCLPVPSPPLRWGLGAGICRARGHLHQADVPSA